MRKDTLQVQTGVDASVLRALSIKAGDAVRNQTSGNGRRADAIRPGRPASNS